MLGCALLALAAVLLIRWFAAEPEYGGRTLSEWVHDLQHGERDERQRAAEALRNFGAEGLPYLSRELTNPPSLVQRAAKAISGRVPQKVKAPLRRIYSPPNEMAEKIAALNALKAMGTNGTSAIPAVAKVFRESNVGISSAAAMTLAEMGTNSVPVMIAALDDGDYNIRSLACHVLASFHTNSVAAVPRLGRIAREERGPISSAAVHTLSRIRGPAIPVLTELVADTNVTVRSQAIYALGIIGAEARSAREAVLGALDDSVAEVRVRAVQTLGALEFISEDGRRAFRGALDDPDPSVRFAGVTAIGLRPRLARENMERLIELLKDESPGVRGAAAFAIGQTGERGMDALPALEQLLEDSDEAVKEKARLAMETIRDSKKLADAKAAGPRN